MRYGLAMAVLACGLSEAIADPVPRSAAACATGATEMARVDLFFGARGPASAWRRFLAEVVTPRFPDGFTVLDGTGQWRGHHGLERERSHVLVIYYRRDAMSDARIEAIRSLYRSRFGQASVLRADTAACIRF